MENYCMSVRKHHQESPEVSYSDDSQDDHHEYLPFVDDTQYFDIDISSPFSPYIDDAQYFDIDISSPFSPRDRTSANSSSISDEFKFDFSISNANPPNPNQCISPLEKLLDKGQLLPLQLIPTPLESGIGIRDIVSSNLPAEVKTQFPRLLKTAAKLKIYFLGFGKSAKPAMDMKSPCAANAGTGVGTDSLVPKKNRLFTMKLKVVEVPLLENSNGAKRNYDNGFQKSEDGERKTRKNMDREKKRAKEMVQMYVKKIKPLYVKISQRSNEKIWPGDLEKLGVRNGVKYGRCQGSERNEKNISFSYFAGNLKMVYQHLGKGKQSPPDIQQKLLNCYGSESTLMEVQSAIQGAIAHCKKSNYIH